METGNRCSKYIQMDNGGFYMNRSKYLLVLQYGTMADILYRDLIERDDVDVFYVGEPTIGRMLYSIRRIHTSIKATKYFEPPFKSIWYYAELKKILCKYETVIFQMDSMIHVGFYQIEKLKKENKKCHFVLILGDSLTAHSWTIPYAKRYIFNLNWDSIISFDKDDCVREGFTYLGYHYYSMLSLPIVEPEFDLQYAGRIKNEGTRKKIVEAIFGFCNDSQVKCSFLLTGIKNKDLIYKNINCCSNNIAYKNVLDIVNKSKCILEVLQPGQMAQTARFFEAVCYNKKLLTNNENVVCLPYYNPDYIKVFHKIDDIDVDWITANDKVQYNYNGVDFSPVGILYILESKG